jgi:exopolysaccharide biosynthesis WecB/TagA/CpsF family protein
VKPKKVKIFGVDIDDASLPMALEYISTHAGSPFSYVVTPNVDHVVRLNKRPDLLPLYRNAALSLCDSRILKRLAPSLGVSIENVVPGSDLTKAFFESGAGSKGVTIIGADEKMVERLCEKYELENCAHYNPPMGFVNSKEEVSKVVRFVVENSSPVTLIAVGSPQQEVVAFEVEKTRQANGVGLCIGASLLFLLGGEKRAPVWVQNISMEWFYRFLCDPVRLFRRYFIDDMYIVKLFFKKKLKNIFIEKGSEF